MRWYCVLCFRASFLKKSTLRLLKAIVTLTPSSRKTNSSGRGRKSGTTVSFPSGSSVYLILSLIDLPSLAPVPGPEDANHASTVREPHREDTTLDPTEAVVSSFARAVRPVLREDAAWIGEGELRPCERDSMLLLVVLILA